MSDYRNLNSDYRDPNDPYRSDARFDLDAREANAAWGWIAAAVFIVIVLAIAFGTPHKPGQTGTNTALNDVTPPAATRMIPPAATRMAPPTMAPKPATPAAPISPAPTPNTPAQGNSQ